MINIEEFTREYERQMQRKTTAVVMRPKMVAVKKCNCVKCRQNVRRVAK